MKFTVPGDHPALDGHFPGRPVVPGVLLLDYVLDAIEARHVLPLPLRLPRVKFARSLLPGEGARVELEPMEAGDGDGGGAQRWRFRVLRDDGVLLASGEVAA
jgi:3-hydroxymyristoyl/3-hydroxydecanoyl-(acyl carrier protein) dehydratase